MSGEKDPLIIIARDRVTCLKKLVAWAERYCDPIIILDQASKWQPLIEWYKTCPYDVRRSKHNHLKFAPWKMGILKEFPKQDYIISDPDVEPIEECPEDAIEVMRYGAYKWNMQKVGFGLLAGKEDNPVQAKARAWSRNVRISGDWKPDRRFHNCHGIDTTFALYPKHAVRQYKLGPALRTRAPYAARHEGYFLDPDNISEELKFYYGRATNAGFMKRNFQNLGLGRR